MKPEQKTALANRIAERLNLSVKDNQTQNADAARSIVDAIDKLCNIGYYDEAKEQQVQSALALIEITMKLVDITGVAAIEQPARVPELT